MAPNEEDQDDKYDLSKNHLCRHSQGECRPEGRTRVLAADAK